MSAIELVANGKRFLDGKFPGWERFIELEELEMASGLNCVLGQLARKDPRLSDLIDAANRKRREELAHRGWAPQNIRPMPGDFYSACFVLGFDGKEGGRAVEYGFDFDNGVNFDEVGAEWRDVIREEQDKWTSLDR